MIPSPQSYLSRLIPKLTYFFHKYNRPEFISHDPISIPHRYSEKFDIEISGFLTALISWGKRENIIKSANEIQKRMDFRPHQFVSEFQEIDLKVFDNFVYRTFNAKDLQSVLRVLQRIYVELCGLETVFSFGVSQNSEDVSSGLIHLKEIFTEFGFPQESAKHIPDIQRGSAAKKMNMFLRWMVRRDEFGVDFGIWKTILPSQLLIPLDVHTGKTAREWGLLTRKQNDFKAVKELTENLKLLDPLDPVKFDYSLFGASIFGYDDI